MKTEQLTEALTATIKALAEATELARQDREPS
jgi:hypothetical protein